VAADLRHYNIGQRPCDMGFETIMALDKLSKGGTVEPFIKTGTEVCTPEDALTTCGKVAN
jgi:ribose transport system substrate-binding protein